MGSATKKLDVYLTCFKCNTVFSLDSSKIDKIPKKIVCGICEYQNIFEISDINRVPQTFRD